MSGIHFIPAASGGGGSAPDADATTKGLVKLAGDLGGTADAPTVPALADKADAAATTTALAGKAATSHTHAQADVTGLTAALAAKADDAATTTALAAKAPLASPTFTGDPKAPTPAQGDNDTSIATTAYVQTEAGLLIPKSLIDAKGDLLVGTADNTVARKAIGTDGQVLTADAASGGGLKWGDPQGPWLLALDPVVATRVGSWQNTRGQQTNHFWGWFTEQSSAAQNDSLAWNVWVPAGTWTLKILTVTYTDSAIVTVSFDGTSAGTIDLYTGSLTYEVVASLTGISLGALPAAGYRTLMLKAATKNGSSSNYKMRISQAWLIRTA